MSEAAALFLCRFCRDPRGIGAIAPSSPHLARAMLAPVDLSLASVIVELGPGTGALTSLIAPALGPATRYLGVELDPAFGAVLRRRFPRLDVAHADAATLPALLRSRGLGPVDAILCGLPWAAVPLAQQERVMAAILASLAPDGVFVTFAYLQGLLLPAARLFRRRLAASFGRVERSPIVWRNLPPAFAYICRAPRAGSGV